MGVLPHFYTWIEDKLWQNIWDKSVVIMGNILVNCLGTWLGQIGNPKNPTHLTPLILTKGKTHGPLGCTLHRSIRGANNNLPMYIWLSPFQPRLMGGTYNVMCQNAPFYSHIWECSKTIYPKAYSLLLHVTYLRWMKSFVMKFCFAKCIFGDLLCKIKSPRLMALPK
jgi:hypothetical protein